MCAVLSGLSVKVLKSPGAPVECGVCSASHTHCLAKQSVKFGIICCDACRKFITKMILRARSADNSVPCDKGQGKYFYYMTAYLGGSLELPQLAQSPAIKCYSEIVSIEFFLGGS